MSLCICMCRKWISKASFTNIPANKQCWWTWERFPSSIVDSSILKFLWIVLKTIQIKHNTKHSQDLDLHPRIVAHHYWKCCIRGCKLNPVHYAYTFSLHITRCFHSLSDLYFNLGSKYGCKSVCAYLQLVSFWPSIAELIDVPSRFIYDWVSDWVHHQPCGSWSAVCVLESLLCPRKILAAFCTNRQTSQSRQNKTHSP